MRRFATLIISVALTMSGLVASSASTASGNETPESLPASSIGSLSLAATKSGGSANATDFGDPTDAYPLTPFYEVAGKYTLSTDGLGTTSSSGTLQVEKPSSQATVRKAFLMASQKSTGTSSPTPRASLQGTQITYSKEVSGQTLSDVTSIVASIVDTAPAGITNLTLSGANNAEGYGLAVVFYDPSLPYSGSVVLSFGRADMVGSTTQFDFSTVLDKQTYMDVTMSLGISFGYQGDNASNSHSCTSYSGCIQRSNISLTLDNSSTPIYITSTAGGADDAVGTPTNGNLLTVGGVGDTVSKPVNSTSSTTTTTPIDSEIYSLIDVLPNGTQSFSLTSSNPSFDDVLFFAGFHFKGLIADGVDTSGNSSIPVITDISPCFGPTAGGTSVTISGANLSGATSVAFGNTAGTITSNSATSIVITTPAKSAGLTDVSVATPAGNEIKFDGFQYGDTLTVCDGSVAAASAPATTTVSAPAPIVANGYRADKLGTVYFATLSSELSKTAKKKLEAAVIANPSAVYKITGYVQKSKSAKNAKNDADLSLARAKAIETYLASLGAGVTFTVVVDAAGVPAKNGKSDKARRATLYAMTPVVQ
jgi:outer membrane protein OmpA-like peptidoglycan-associated protein